jgi:hypothetical protein
MRYAVIVDAYSTGAYLADELKLYGVTCIHVQSTPEILQYGVDSFKPGDFAHKFIATQDIQKLKSSLAAFQPEFVIAGGESGVELADRLSELLGTPGNGTALSPTRRNKWQMAMHLHCNDIPAARVSLIENVKDADSLAESLGGWPIVIKPVNSGGAEGVHFCGDAVEVHESVTMELGKLNQLGHVNDHLLAMEYLAGQQYLVQAVSRDGKHFIFEIWRDTRKRVLGAGVVNDREVLIDPLSDEAAPIIRYVNQCLDAFGVSIGPSFLEIMVTEKGPILIEWAARMMGTQELTTISKICGVNCINLCAACYADSTAFYSMLHDAKRAHLQFEVIAMINSVSGTVHHRRWLDELSARPSFQKMIRAPKVADTVAPTINIFTNYGFIYLAHEDPTVIDDDYLWIRAKESERGGFFDVTPT